MKRHHKSGQGQQGRRKNGASAAVREDLPVQINENYEAEIIGINHDGEGVGRVNGFTLFVAGALPGERVLVRVEHLKKQYGYAKLLSVLEASAERVVPACGIYEQCGGCQLQHLSYEAQLKVKRQQVIDNLERIGKLRVAGSEGVRGQERQGMEQDAGQEQGQEQGREQGQGQYQGREQGQDQDQGIVVHPTLGMSDPWRYRNKAQVPFGEEEGGLIGGFYAQGSHRIVDMETCLIQHKMNDDVVHIVKQIGTRLGIRAYREETNEGLLRHVVVKVGFRTDEIMVVLITNGEKIPHLQEWIDGIRAAIPGVQSICQNVNTKRTNVIFGDMTRVLWGREVIYDYIGDVKFAISVSVSP
jgi:23S rRNA (uracil1939-C5)-methyltransferase